MRILYHHRIASSDGQLTHIEEMMSALHALGHEIVLVGPRVHTIDVGNGGSAGWVGKLKLILPAALYELAEAAYSVIAYLRLHFAFRKFKPDVIYERYALFQLAGIWLSRRSGVPLLLEVNAPGAISRREYGQLRLGRFANACERYALRSAAGVLPVTRVLGDILAHLGVESSKIHVVPNGINPTAFVDLPTPDEAKSSAGLSGRVVVGFIGFVREWDRLNRIIDWLSRRPRGDLTSLRIVGDGPARVGLEQLARKLGIADRLSFTGVLSRNEVPRQAMAFDIAIQTALVPYASPLCLFEYMALGKAIVAPNQANHREILEAGVNCLMFDPDDSSDMENQLEVLVQNCELRIRLGNAARNTLHDGNYSWSRNAERVAQVADLVLSNRNSV